MRPNPTPFYDPLFDATAPLVQRYAAVIWDSKFSLGRLQKAWMAVSARLQGRPTWRSCRGPIRAVALSLQRVGWTILNDEQWVTEAGVVVDVFKVATVLVKQLLLRSVAA